MILRDGIEDLEVLLNRVYDKEIKELVKEAIGCYSQGFYRASIISLWNALIYDSYKKAKYLIQNLNDPDSVKLLADINKMIEAKNYVNELGLIKDYLYKKLQMINEHNVEQLSQIQGIRNKCSHPSFAEDDKIYTPFPEEVRASIRVAIEIVLSKQPILGKKVMEKIIEDVTGPYFANSVDKFEEVLYSKYLNQSDISLTVNLLKLSAKKIFNKDLKFIEQKTYGRILISISNQNPELQNIHNLKEILDKITDNNLKNLIHYMPFLQIEENLFSKELLIKLDTFIDSNASLSNNMTLMTKYLLSLKYEIYNTDNILNEINDLIKVQEQTSVIANILLNNNIYLKDIELLFRSIISIIPLLNGFIRVRNFIQNSLSPLLNKINNEELLKELFINILNNHPKGINQFFTSSQIFENLETIINSLNKEALKMKCFEEFMEKVNEKYLDSDHGIYEELNVLIQKRLANN